MKASTWFFLLFAGASLVLGCHNTVQGVKDDTRNAVHKTGHAVERGGEKIDHSAK